MDEFNRDSESYRAGLLCSSSVICACVPFESAPVHVDVWMHVETEMCSVNVVVGGALMWSHVCDNVDMGMKEYCHMVGVMSDLKVYEDLSQLANYVIPE